MPNQLTHNQVKFLASLSQKKNRIEHGRTVVEGVRVLKQLLDNGLCPDEIYITHEKPEYADILRKAASAPVFELNTREFNRITDTLSPQGIAALFPIEQSTLEKRNFLLYLDHISDPGNMGAIMRTAAAAGVDGVVLSPECCELSNPKVIRSSLGASLFMPSEVHDPSWLSSFDYVYAADASGEDVFTNDNLLYPIILVIGSEAHGLSEEVKSLCDKTLSIPMTNRMESLNAAVSTAVLIYEIRRKNTR